MNDRNVAALERMIASYCEAKGVGEDISAELLAHALAARGVLVPAALTDDEVDSVCSEGKDCLPEEAPRLYPTEARSLLERIAKGEP